MFKTKKTDFLAIALSLLLLPLFFNRPSYSQLFQVASNVEIYSDSYNKEVKAPVGFLNYKLSSDGPNVPYLLFPAYSFTHERPMSDMVRFVNFEKELLYGQRYETPFHSPYVSREKLFTPGKIVEETQFKDQEEFKSVEYSASGRIIQYSQQVGDHIAGLTENFEVFYSDRDRQIFSSKHLSDDFNFAFEKTGVGHYFSPKISICEQGILVVVSGLTEEAAFVFSGLIDEQGRKEWFKVARIPKNKLVVSEDDSLIREINLQTDVVKENGTFGELARCLQEFERFTNHGETVELGECGNNTIYLTSEIAYLQNMQTGNEVASFLIFPGVLLAPGEIPEEFNVHFVSDEGMREAARLGRLDKYNFKFDALSYSLRGETLKDLQIRPNYATILSENHDYIENAMNVDINDFSPILSPLTYPYMYHVDDRSFVVYVAPNGVIYHVNAATGIISWKTPIPDFMATTHNTHLSVQEMGAQERLIVLTMGHRIMVFDAASGALKNIWKIPEVVDIYDAAMFDYDDGVARAKVQVQTASIHPYLEKRSLFIIRDGYMDVLQLSDASVSLVDFWERIGLLTLTTVLLAVVLRLFGREEKKE